MRRVIRLVQDQRDARYNLLRGYFHGADDDSGEDGAQARLHSLTLPAGAFALGRRLDAVMPGLRAIRILSLRRRNGKSLPPEAHLCLEDGDTLVLSGQAEALALAEEKLLRG
jgi:CPA2 family monovalent cation:H+ antiporter-2